MLMPCAHRWVVLGLFLAAPILVVAQTAATPTQTPAAAPTPSPAVTPSAPRHHKSHKSHTTTTQIALPPLPSGPLSQLPMEQIPATPAKVSYQGGLLTISAQNSSLSEILRDVRKLTGASIEIPQGPSANERVVAHLGPGAPRDVLAGLLNGSSFNYVMLGSSADPTAVSSVMLMAKPLAPGDVQTAANVYENNAAPAPASRFPQPQPFNQQNLIAQRPPNGQLGLAQPANADAEADDKDDDAEADDKDDDAAQAQPDANAQDQPQQSDTNQPNAGPKTPEQILEMLRRPQQPGGAAPIPPQPQPPQP
jgi:hypothetical protein